MLMKDLARQTYDGLTSWTIDERNSYLKYSNYIIVHYFHDFFRLEINFQIFWGLIF